MTTLQHLPDRFRCSHLYVIIYHLCFSHGASCCAGWEIWGEPVPPSVAQSVESVSRLVVGIWDNMFTYTSEKFHLNLTGSWHDRLVSTLSLKVPMWYKEALPIGYDNRLLARRGILSWMEILLLQTADLGPSTSNHHFWFTGGWLHGCEDIRQVTKLNESLAVQ